MPDAREIVELAEYRAQRLINDLDRWDRLSKVYRGKHRDLAPQYFRRGDIDKTAGLIRRSWDMFAHLVGIVPDKQVTPLGLGLRDRERAERQEKILINYDRVWHAANHYQTMASRLVGFGAVAVGTFADPTAPEGQAYPQMLVEDPRNVYPGPKWTRTSASLPGTGNTGGTRFDLLNYQTAIRGGLEDIIVRKRLAGFQIRKLFGNIPGVPDTPQGLRADYPILQHYDTTHVTTVLEVSQPTILSSVPHGAPWCPWQYIAVEGVDCPAGASMFESQIGLELVFARILDQKLALNDAVVWPWLKQRGVAEFEPNNRRIKLLTPDADVVPMSPPVQFEVQQDLSMLRDLLRVLNGETEATQGTVRGGPVTGRGILELNSMVTESVRFFFRTLAHALPDVYTTAMIQDATIYGDRTKMLSGRGHGEPFFESYNPAKDIGSKLGMVSVEFGPGLGRFEDHLQLLQDLGSDTMSRRRVMEKNPHIPSVTDEERRILVDKLEGLLFESSLTGASPVPPQWIASLAKAVEDGQDWRQWIIDNPPAVPPPAGPPGGPAAPGPLPELPPELAALVG